MPFLRLVSVFALALLAGCPGPGGLAAGPPRTVDGGWTLANAGEQPIPPYGALSPEKVWITEYRGPEDIKATFYRYGSSTVAFEAMQKRTREPEELSFHQGVFLVVVDGKGVTKAAAQGFIEGVLKTMR